MRDGVLPGMRVQDLGDLACIESFCTKPAYNAPFGLVITPSATGPLGETAIAVPAKTFLLLR